MTGPTKNPNDRALCISPNISPWRSSGVSLLHKALAVGLATEAIDNDLPAYEGLDPSTAYVNIPRRGGPPNASGSGSGSGPSPATLAALAQIPMSPALPTPSLDEAVSGDRATPSTATPTTAPWENWE